MIRIADYACRAVLRLYPRDIREAHAAEMRETFLEVCAIRSSIPELGNLAVAAVKARAGYPRISSGQEPPPARSGGPMMWRDDLRHAVRRLRSGPGVTIAAVLMLALAIGLSTAMFSLIDAVIVRPVPFPEADRLAHVWMRGPRGGSTVVAPAVFRAWRDSPAFDRVEGTSTKTFLLNAGENLTSRDGAFVSPGLLEMLGAEPIAGRLFAADEGRGGTDDRVILSEGLWRSMLGGDPSAVGRTLLLDGANVTVVGVLPDEFRFPSWGTALWRPLDFLAPPAAEADRRARVIARVAAHVPAGDAMKTATTAAHHAASLQPNQWAQADPLAAPRRGQYARQSAPVLAAAAVMVFLVLCANVSGLLMARLDRRMREIGVAAALGASRGRLLREALLESVCLAAAGLAVGLGLAAGLLAIARAYLPAALVAGTLNPASLDERAFLAASLAGIAAVLFAGVLPAWLATRVSAISVLRPASRGGTESRASRTARRVLLATEVALACTLLVGASLLVRSFVRMSGADRGLDSEGVVVAWLEGIGGQKPTREGTLAGSRQIKDAMLALPGVQTVAFSFGAPPAGGGFTSGQWISDVPGVAPVDATFSQFTVGPDFFALYRIPIVRGRAFEPEDDERTVVIGERVAALLFPNVDPVGRSFRIEQNPPMTVIGVARELHLPTTETRDDRPEFYFHYIGAGSRATLNIRCNAVCPDVARVRQAVRDAQPGADPWRMEVVSEQYLAQVEGPRAAAALVLTFSAIAMVAVAGGLFALLSYSASRRRGEFGIRLALGARPREIRALMLGEGARVVVAGSVLGVVAGWWLARSLSAVIYGVSPNDAITWALVPGLLFVTTVAASWPPAARAARVDPSRLLRED